MHLKLVRFAYLALFLAACSKHVEEREKPPVPVQVTSVTQATIRHIVQGEGVLYPIDQASITPKVSAPVQQFYVRRGDQVKRGQLLAVLENRDLIYSAAESKGAVEQAQANLRTTEVSTIPESVVKAQTDLRTARDSRDSAKRILESRQQLFKQGALAGRLVDDAQVAYGQAEGQYLAAEEHLKALESARQDQISSANAQVRTAQAHFDSQQAQVTYSRIVSPISGIVADRPLNAGEMANAGSPLITVVDISRIVARVNVSESEASAVQVGQTATLTQPDSKEGVEGKVTVVSPSTDPNTTTVQIWIEIANPDQRLRPGMPVHAAIATEIFKAATVVPATAILPGEEGGTSVITISADSIAHKRTVTLGIREGNLVQILTGANPGEEVVIVGGMGLDDNTKVKVVTTAVEESTDDDDQDNAPSSSGQKAGAQKDQSKQK
jgi:multidrug efflux pump subunit AcrA (membrane-fusion protein)